jgi:hypothetical protein
VTSTINDSDGAGSTATAIPEHELDAFDGRRIGIVAALVLVFQF